MERKKRGVSKIVQVRATSLPPEVHNFLDNEIQQGKKQTQAICDLLKKGLTAIEQEKAAFESLHQREGASIDTHRYVQQGDPVLIPCPNTNTWKTKRQCEGCHLKCQIPKDLRVLFEGLALYTKT